MIIQIASWGLTSPIIWTSDCCLLFRHYNWSCFEMYLFFFLVDINISARPAKLIRDRKIFHDSTRINLFCCWYNIWDQTHADVTVSYHSKLPTTGSVVSQGLKVSMSVCSWVSLAKGLVSNNCLCLYKWKTNIYALPRIDWNLHWRISTLGT